MRKDGVRPASPADLDEILAIERRRPTAPGWTRPQFEHELSWPRAVLNVLEDDGSVAGYAGLWMIPPEGQVTTLVVAPEKSGRGLGRALLESLIEACRAGKCSKMTLEVSARNPPAIGLYKSAGFRVVGERPKFYNDGSNALLMDLLLEKP